jgi:hypothetical protein
MRRGTLRLYASRLAADLRLPLRVDPIEGVLKKCEQQVRSILADFERDAEPCTSLSLLADLVANKLRTSFEVIRTDDDLIRVRRTQLANEEVGFARLEDDLGPGMYGLTIRLLNPEPWGMRFISVIDCRGSKRHREFYTKWHELSHLLVLTDQMRLVFRRTHEKRNNPEEQLIDLIAGRCGFHRTVVERFATATISFDLLDELRATLCPEASRQAAIIGFVNSWPTACVLIRAELALKAAEERFVEEASTSLAPWHQDVRQTLRARHVTLNDSARAMNLGLFRNMRIPERSVIARVFAGEVDEASAVEDLSWWDSGGTHLPAHPVHVAARRGFDGVDVLLLPSE